MSIYTIMMNETDSDVPEPPVTGLAWLLHRIKYIQTKIEDFIDEDGKVIEIRDTGEFVRKKKVEYLGIKVPEDAIVITEKGCIGMAKPKCPRCHSLNVRKNGTRKRVPQTPLGMKVEIKIQKYQCADCGKNFDPDLTKFVYSHQRYTQEIQATAIMLQINGLSYKEIAEFIEMLYGVKVSPQAIMYWVKNFSGEIVENERDGSEVVHFDEQRVMIDGKECWRYTIIDTKDNVICDRVEEKRDGETIERVLIEELGGREVSCVVTDLDRKYDSAIERLRREIGRRKGIPLTEIKIRHQLCVFHQLLNIRKVLEEIYRSKLKSGMSEEGKKLLKEIANIFRSKDRLEAWKKLAKLYARDDIPWRLRKELEKIGERFENLTWYLEDASVPMTNNKIELYYRTTDAWRVKKRFKTKEGVEATLKFYKAAKEHGKNIMLTVGLLAINLWQILGFLVGIIR